ncbi:SGNH/GDSL hydrolase family protein [Marinicella meishanensis]|uniref:SGNH/GDSL hydrolase family protein n=1 Tax=Marinicella meishanensis TaxID=2873263 RepID=UPI001CBC79E9|nr:SGNH/GDSL hydrolase family protein [Marinicella sp. NBU2979]
MQRRQVFHTMISLALLKVLLGPVLLIQGWWVRKHTPILPEPVKQNSGKHGQGQALSLMLLGDSSAAGVGAPTAEQSLLGQLLQRLSTDHCVNYQLRAATGNTTADVLTELAQQPAEHCDVVVTALGVNDVTSQVSLGRWRRQQLALIDLIQHRFSPRLIIMSGLPPVREFPALLWPLNAYLGACADAKNELLQAMLAAQDGVHFLSLRGYPESAQAATDGFHPGPEVYEIWSEDIVKVIKNNRSG